MHGSKGTRIIIGMVTALLLTSPIWGDLPLIIESFPSLDQGGPPGLGKQFEINPIDNTALEFGVESIPDRTPDCLMMAWGPEADTLNEEWEGAGGWELVFGEDPDLRGGQISLSVNPPGGIDANGAFVGILSISVVAVDMGGNVAGGWGFNTDQMSGIVGDDPLPNLANNVMHNVTINIGAGPVAGSATVASIMGVFTGPNFLIPGNNNFANIGSLQFFENGILRAQTPIPNQPIPRLLNYWDHVTVIPAEPVPVDIKPTSCPNPLNVKSQGLLPVAICGTDTLDVTQIDPTAVRLEGVAPLRWELEDVATPYVPFLGKKECSDCTEEGPDGHLDLTLKFAIQEVVAALGPVEDGDCRVLTLTGVLILGEDVVVIRKKGKK